MPFGTARRPVWEPRRRNLLAAWGDGVAGPAAQGAGALVGVLGGEAALLQRDEGALVAGDLERVGDHQLEAREERGQRVEEAALVVQGQQRRQALAVLAAVLGDARDVGAQQQQ